MRLFMLVSQSRDEVSLEPRYWKFLHEEINRSSSIKISCSSVAVGEWPEAGTYMYSVFELSFFDLLPVWIVSPKRLKCLTMSEIPFFASSCESVRKAASSTYRD